MRKLVLPLGLLVLALFAAAFFLLSKKGNNQDKIGRDFNYDGYVRMSKYWPQAIKDAKTQITYHLESDGRHVSAINSDGKLLWRCEVFKASDTYERYVESISFGCVGDVEPALDNPHFNADDYIGIMAWDEGHADGAIDKKTGVLSWSVNRF